MSSHRTSNFSESENTCVVCFKIVDVFSVGVCDHPVCFECSTRMRVLCNQLECPICRREMPIVIFSKEIEPFSILKRVENTKLYEQRYGIYFSTPSLQRRYNHLLDHECFICRRMPNFMPFKTFHQLKEHMRRAHELFYCELCVLNLKIFSFERKCYTRVELATHRRKGDPDNTSHRGHPLCEFCETRFMDNDELFRHLRRDHFFCQFCDADGKHQYYNTYNDLRRHYLDEHYLCEEGDCKHDRFTSAFRTDIDLKAHYAALHGKNLSRAANRQARTLELEFTLAPRVRPDGTNSRGGRNYGQRYAERYKENNVASNSESYVVEPGGFEGEAYENQLFNNPLNAENFPLLGSEANISNALRTVSNVTITSKVNPLSEENFPTLGGGTGTSKQSAVTITKTTVRGQNGLARNRANFPTLGETSSSSSVRLSVNGNKQDHPSYAKTPNLSIHVNHKSNGEITTRINQSTSNGQTISVRPKTSSEAFPALSTSDVKVTQPQWVQPKRKKQQEPKENNKVAPDPNIPSGTLNDFPTLNKNGKGDSKKIASSSVWVNLNNFNSSTATKKNKLVAKSSKTIELEKPNPSDIIESNDNKIKSSKKKISKKNPTSSDDLANTINKINISTGSDAEKKHTPNGIIKKRSELNLEVSDPSTIIGYVNDVSSAGVTKPPPGFKLKPPPGLNNFPSGNNDLVFTNSSGQSYQISTQQFFPPQNFKLRNQSLIEKFKVVLQTTDAIQYFKIQSDLFRSGEISAEKYYEYCKCSMGNDFDSLFPELLILLPNIQRQQDLYAVYKNKNKEINLDVCATCYQVVLKGDLRAHLSNHVLDNHFPVLNHMPDNNVAWNAK